MTNELKPEIEEPVILLTGATGLVGRYLLAGLLERHREVAVVTRSSGLANAEQRVDSALAELESERLIARPRVLEGTLHQANLALCETDLDWLGARTLVVIHCAASIRFQLDDSGEPYRTNVDGTRHLLNLCRGLKVEAFHYISTAYVGCRTNESTVFEVPVSELSQDGAVPHEQAANDYELSKIRSEALVRECGWLEKAVIHRPSIVVGDSRSGYTSTFHGFYAPLQIGAQYARLHGFSAEAGDWFREKLGLEESDSKNLVNVDWLAAGIVEAVLDRDVPHDSVIHWTNPKPVSCHEMQRAIVDSIFAKFAGSSDEPQDQEASSRRSEFTPPSANDFREQLQVYTSYFQSDPHFDTQNQRRFSTDLECPELDYASLYQLAEFALGTGFGWPRPPVLQPCHQEVSVALRQFQISEFPSGDTCSLILQMLGPGAPEQMVFAEGATGWFRCINAGEGEMICLKLPFAQLAACTSGTTGIDALIVRGEALIVADDYAKATRYIANWLVCVKSLMDESRSRD